MSLQTDSVHAGEAPQAPPRASPLPGRLSQAEVQELRLKRFFIAATTSLVALGLFFSVWLAGLIGGGVLLAAAALTLAGVGGFYAAFRSNFNLRFADPTLLLPQAACAIAVTSFVMAHAGPARPLLMMLYFAALMFYAFRFSRREFTILSAYTVLCYVLSAAAARLVDPGRADLTVDLLQGFFLLVALPWTGWIAYYLNNLRRRVRANEAMYRAIWEISIDAVLIFDHRGIVRFANPSAMRLFGYEAAELIGIDVAALQPEEKREALRREIGSYFLNGVQGRNWRRFEDSILTRDGREVPVEAALAEMGGLGGMPGLFAGNERRMVVFLRNISRRRALETIKDDFISTVSHELRTPLMGVIGAVEALQAGDGGELPEASKALLAMAGQGADRLHHLIDTILNLQKIESGGITFAPEPVDAGELMLAAVKSEKRAAEAAKRRLRLMELPAGVLVRADPRWVRKALEHLIDNALKYTPPGSTITLSAIQHEQVVSFMVSDEGPGVPAQFAASIFNKFTLADTSPNRERGGAGLGLSFCKAIVEGCGGRIGYHNNPEHGATFWFELPHARSQA